VSEVENGLLAMVDIRGSTILANTYGAEQWKRFVNSTEGPIRRIAQRHGFALQLVVWDAYFFTTPVRSLAPSNVQMTFDFAWEVRAFMEEALRSAFPGRTVDPQMGAIRVCLEFGDISRDLLNGVWTISGAAMACVHKLEAVCKKIPGWFFFTAQLPNPDTSRFPETNEAHPSTGARIMSASFGIVGPLHHSARESDQKSGLAELIQEFRQTWEPDWNEGGAEAGCETR
jgi:hypothetical protein